MPLVPNGVNFTDPAEFQRFSDTATTLNYTNSGASNSASSTTAAFTGFATMGLQDNTDWTANTYKTILSVTGSGFVAGYIGCTAGGAETHTVEWTVDGVLKEIAIVNASGERACFLSSTISPTAYTTAGMHIANINGTLDSGKTTLGGAGGVVPPWTWLGSHGTPLLRFKTSLLIRAKHSANITNSTSTAYSAVIYRVTG